MSKDSAKTPAFEYLNGRDFTDKLREITKCESYELLADYFGVPKSTIFTWHSHNRTAFELIVRAHLATGASVKYMALGEGEPFPEAEQEPAGISIPTFRYNQGFLEDEGAYGLDTALLNFYGLDESNTMIVSDDYDQHFVDRSKKTPNTGKYLVKFDGVYNFSKLTRMPGKLIFELGDGTFETTVEELENQIEIVGRVVACMRKE